MLFILKNKIFCYLLVFTCLAYQCKAQKISFITKEIPVKNGIIYDVYTQHCEPSCDKFELIIETKNDSCFSICDGILFKSLEIDSNYFSILIKLSNKLFVSYSIFKEKHYNAWQEGTSIKKGDFLGLIQGDDRKKNLIVNFIDNKGEFYRFEKNVKLLKQFLTE